MNASIECAHFLLHQGLPFHGHDECECLSNQGNYLELLHFLFINNEAIKRVTFSEAPRYNKLTSLDIQKDITQAASSLKAVIEALYFKHGLSISRLRG